MVLRIAFGLAVSNKVRPNIGSTWSRGAISSQQNVRPTGKRTAWGWSTLFHGHFRTLPREVAAGGVYDGNLLGRGGVQLPTRRVFRKGLYRAITVNCLHSIVRAWWFHHLNVRQALWTHFRPSEATHDVGTRIDNK